MPVSAPSKTLLIPQIKNVFFLSLILFSVFLSSCRPFGIIQKNYQKGKPFVTKNSIEVKGGKFTKDELIALKSRLNAQLDDSSKINVVDHYFVRHVYNKPPVYDSFSAARSAKNMKLSMVHLGYYKANAYFTADTNLKHHQLRVHVKYVVEPGPPTLIDTFGYYLKKPDLQQIAINNSDNSLVQEGRPVTKAAVLGEIDRLVVIYRNQGYYKFTSEELRMRGDTTLEVLTNITDDPFEQLRLLAEAQQKKDSPKIKLALVLNPPTDSNKLKQYYINNIYILPDYRPGDRLNDSTLTERTTARTHYIIRYHNKRFRTGFLTRNMLLKKGELYNQENFYKSLNNYARAGVWQSANIEVVEIKEKDSVNKLNLIVQLIPTPQYSFEAGVEASYSATSNTNTVTAASAGNLLGLSGTVSHTNRNLGKEAIKMTTSLRAGVEFNLKSDSSNTKNLINSNDLSLSNSIVFPRFIYPFKELNKNPHFKSTESFINTNASYINRINLFNLQSFNLSLGYSAVNRRNAQLIFKPINIEFTKLYNQSTDFDNTLIDNPFLRYSFNTALVAGASIGYSNAKANLKNPNHQHGFKANLEESGFPFVPIPLPLRKMNVFTKYLRQYLKMDVEYSHTRTSRSQKSALVFRVFGGVGFSSKKDTTLPFFKQYFGGGSNSMRGWPVRGIGRGSQPLAPYGYNRFNDRTGDLQFETNLEYRFTVAQLIPNTMTLKMALFADAGNIWNLRNTKPSGGTDSAQFKFKNVWKEMGINAGTGFRLDFNYFVLRFDFGFRFKRPELSYINDGWKAPPLSFNDVFKKVFTKGPNDEYRRWRYENFNFTIGINYPF
ncbi:translocation and assembly module lipoprotein TamL [Ferruginibacter sp.]